MPLRSLGKNECSSKGDVAADKTDRFLADIPPLGRHGPVIGAAREVETDDKAKPTRHRRTRPCPSNSRILEKLDFRLKIFAPVPLGFVAAQRRCSLPNSPTFVRNEIGNELLVSERDDRIRPRGTARR